MIALNDYLYSGDTVLRILHNYADDLKKEADRTGNEIDLIHHEFLHQMIDLLEHNEFLTAQSRKSGNFICIWQKNIHIWHLHLKDGSNP